MSTTLNLRSGLTSVSPPDNKCRTCLPVLLKR
jgi:hypothetical protein